jgi:hypothetical protein
MFLIKQQLIIKWEQDKPDQKSKSNKQNRFNFGVGAGMAVAFPVNKNISLEVNVEDHLGFVDINDENISGGKQKTNSFNFTTGVIVSLRPGK